MPQRTIAYVQAAGRRRTLRQTVLAVLSIFVFCLSFSSASSNEADRLSREVLQLSSKGRYVKAIPAAKKLAALREKTFGPDHPLVAGALFDVADLYENAGRYSDAEPFLKRSLAILERTVGVDDPRLLIPFLKAVEFYYKQSRFAEAEPLLKKTLVIFETARGPNHPEVAMALAGLADNYEKQGRYLDAESVLKRARLIQENASGSVESPVNDMEKSRVLRQLGGVYIVLNRYAEAEPILKESLELVEKSGRDDRAFINSLFDLADLYKLQSRYMEAETLLRRALNIVESAQSRFGPRDVASCLNRLALLYRDRGRYLDAEPLLRRAVDIYMQLKTPKDSEALIAFQNLGELYINLGLASQAITLLRPAVALYEKTPEVNQMILATVLNNLAGAYSNIGRFAEAEPLLKRSIAIYEKARGNGPDLLGLATPLNNLAVIHRENDRFAEAEPLFRRALELRRNVLPPTHRLVALSLNNLAELYGLQKRFGEAEALIRQAISNKTADPDAALPILYEAHAKASAATEPAVIDSLVVVQFEERTVAAKALHALAARLSAGSDELASLIRKYQDLLAESEKLNEAILSSASREPSRRDAATERRTRERMDAVAQEITQIQAIIARKFPAYATLSYPEPVTLNELQALLADDEAIVLIRLGAKISYVWAISKTAIEWKELRLSKGDVSEMVERIRSQLNFNETKEFDPKLAFNLYQRLLAPIDHVIKGKRRLSFVANEAMTALTPTVLVTEDPAGKPLKDVAWLIRRQAVTVLPSLDSLKALRTKSLATVGSRPLIGFADPVLGQRSNSSLAATVAAARGIRGRIASLEELNVLLPPLPETADELRKVATFVRADPSDIHIGTDATKAKLLSAKLDSYRIVYFATHALAAGEPDQYNALNVEPALVLSAPANSTKDDDAMLTASEVAQLKLNAEWVVLSACNTASGERPGADALSGLAKAFFYAGGRSLIVSYWAVESKSAVALMTGTFSAIAADPSISHAEALRKSILSLIDDERGNAKWVDPKYWAPFVVVGEPPKAQGM